MITAPRPRLSLWALWNLSFGLLGVQLGSALMLIHFVRNTDHALFWLAWPVMGLLLQPLAGAMTDGAWTALGRRRPVILGAAVVGGFALFFLITARSGTLALLWLWLLFATLNAAVVQYRSLMVETAPIVQQTNGFLLQGLCISLGAAAAFSPRWFFAGADEALVFFMGLAAVLLVLTGLWTMFFAREHPPENLEEYARSKSARGEWRVRPSFLGGGAALGALLALLRLVFLGSEVTAPPVFIGAGIGLLAGFIFSKHEISAAAREIPRSMKQLAGVQALTWAGLFCFWMVFDRASSQQILGSPDVANASFNRVYDSIGALTWLPLAGAGAVFLLMLGCRLTTRRMVHSLALLAGGACLLASGYVTDALLWKCLLIGVGAAWVSSLSLPYAMVAALIPAGRAGVYMGLFHCAIAAAEIAVFCLIAPMMSAAFPHDPVKGMMLGGALLLAAAVLTQFVGEGPAVTPIVQTVAAEEGLLPDGGPPEAPAT